LVISSLSRHCCPCLWICCSVVLFSGPYPLGSRDGRFRQSSRSPQRSAAIQTVVGPGGCVTISTRQPTVALIQHHLPMAPTRARSKARQGQKGGASTRTTGARGNRPHGSGGRSTWGHLALLPTINASERRPDEGRTRQKG